MPGRLALAVAIAAALALPAAASASSISYEGDTLVFHAAPGETNFVVVDGDDQQVTFTDDYAIDFPSDRCSQSDPEYPRAGRSTTRPRCGESSRRAASVRPRRAAAGPRSGASRRDRAAG